MAYQLSWRPSPSYTPGNQTQANYGRPRTIEIGAGHWWDDPSRGPSFEGVINSLTNPNRQVSAHAVVTNGRVAELVRQGDTAWCTGNANPFTYSIECDPRITTGGATAEAIMQTLAEYIADKGFHNMEWSPHKRWASTGCNPIDWGEVRRRAQAVWNAKHVAPAPAPAPAPANANLSWEQFPAPVVYVPNKNTVALWNFNQTDWAGFKNPVRTFAKDEQITIFGKCVNRSLQNATYLVTEYSFSKRIPNGINQADLSVFVPPVPPAPVDPPKPEWLVNLSDVPDVKLQVLVPQTAIVNLNDLSVIKQLGQGTWVDIAKKTTVGGKPFLISNYSVENQIPNGIFADDLGVPAKPTDEKPEWLKTWQDIADVKMYARADTDLVNLTTGETISVIARGTPIDVASTSEWHGQKYAITEYSTKRKDGRGIRLDDLDLKPVVNDTPIKPAPEQPSLEERVSVLEKLVDSLLKLVKLR